MSDRPTSREEYTTTGSGSVDRRGDGLDLGGPVGNSGGYGSRPGLRRRGGRGWLWLVLILIVINAVSEGVTFADIKQFVSEQIREIDPDEIKEGAGELARSARENIDLAVNGAEGAESREAVADFSGTVSDGDGIISVLAGEKPSAQQGGALLNQDHFEWTRNRKLQKVLALTEQEWENVDTIKLNVFVDDGGVLDVMDYFTGHTFRHTFATRCFEAGIQPKVVQKYLGHATLQMTMDLYTHVTDELAQEDIEKISLADI